MSRNESTGQKSAVPRDESDRHFRYDFEPARQGGSRYLICVHCGRETIHDTQPERIDHQRGCPLA